MQKRWKPELPEFQHRYKLNLLTFIAVIYLSDEQQNTKVDKNLLSSKLYYKASPGRNNHCISLHFYFYDPVQTSGLSSGKNIELCFDHGSLQLFTRSVHNYFSEAYQNSQIFFWQQGMDYIKRGGICISYPVRNWDYCLLSGLFYRDIRKQVDYFNIPGFV